MKFEPGPILFYGGPMHGRIMTVDRPTYVLHKQGPPQFLHQESMTECIVPMPRRFYYNYTPIGESVYLHDPKWNSHSGLLKRDSIAYVMICEGKKYDSTKVWNMMTRYKIMPGYRSQTLPVN